VGEVEADLSRPTGRLNRKYETNGFPSELLQEGYVTLKHWPFRALTGGICYSETLALQSCYRRDMLL
jgi:hypothetical protein